MNSVLLIAGLLGASPQAGPRVSYFGLRTLGMDSPVSAELNHSIQTTLADQGRRPVLGSPETAAECKVSHRCYCEAARAQGSEQALFGHSVQADRLFTFELVLLNTQDCAIDNTVFVTEEHDLASAEARLTGLVRDLLRPLETVGETAVKGRRDVASTPAILTVITAKQIRQFGITRVEEIFRLVPGFEIVDLNYVSRVLHHGISSTLLILVDGAPLHNGLVSFSGFGADMRLSVNNIERVEFIRGPTSVLWGTEALLGVVNFITRSDQTEKERIAGHVRYGTLDTQEVFASVSANKRQYRYYFGASATRTRGPEIFVEDSPWTDPADGLWGNAGTTDPGFDRYYELVAKLGLFDFAQLGVKYFDSREQYEISPRGALLASNERGSWEKSHLLYSLELADSLPGNLRYQFLFDRHEAMFWERFAFYPANPDAQPLGQWAVQGNESDPIVNHLSEGRLYHRWEGESFTNDVLLGVAYLHQRTPQIYFAMTQGETPGELERDLPGQTLTTASAFVHDDLSLWGDLITLSAGLRYDHHSPFASILNKQAALIVTTDWVSAKLLYDEGFRSPRVNSLYSTSGIRGNRFLEPERSRGATAQVTTWLGEYGEVRLGASLIQMDDLIKINRTNPPEGFFGVPENSARIDIQAAYAELLLRAGSMLDGFVTYAYKTLDESDPVNEGIPVAHHTGSFGLNLRPFNDVGLFASGNFVSDRTVQTLDPEVGQMEWKLNAYFLFDIGVTLSSVFEVFDFTLKFRNPLRMEHWSPLQTTGNVNPITERRFYQEIIATMGFAL